MTTREYPAQADTAADQHLHKVLGFRALYFISLGSIVGSGWLFAVLGADAAAGPSVLIAWAVVGAAMILIALVYTEPGAMLPRSGAVVRYPFLSHGGYVGALMSWAFWLGLVTIPALEAEAIVTYASSYLPGLTQKASGTTILTGPGIGIAIGLMIIFFLINVTAVRFFGGWNTTFSWWKLIVPVATFCLLFTVFRAANFTAYGGFAPMGTKPVFIATSTAGIVFSIYGFRQAIDFGGEARRPSRDLPLAVILSEVTAVVLYILLQVAFTGAISWHAAGIRPGDWAGLSASTWASGPFFHALRDSGSAALGAFAGVLLVDAIISPAGAGWVNLGGAARTLYGMARQDALPARLGTVTRRTRVPLTGVAACTVVGCLFFLPLPGWYQLVGFNSSAIVLTFAMGGVQLIVFRRELPGTHRPFQLRGAQVLAPASFVAAAIIVYWAGYTTLGQVVAGLMLALPLYSCFYARRRGHVPGGAGISLGVAFTIAWLATQYAGPIGVKGIPVAVFLPLAAAEVAAFTVTLATLGTAQARREIRSGAWLLVLLLAEYIISYLGAYGPLKHPVIPFPYDILAIGVIGLGIFYWAVASGHRTAGLAELREAEPAGAGR
jgi:amino acid transporter